MHLQNSQGQKQCIASHEPAGECDVSLQQRTWYCCTGKRRSKEPGTRNSGTNICKKKCTVRPSNCNTAFSFRKKQTVTVLGHWKINGHRAGRLLLLAKADAGRPGQPTLSARRFPLVLLERHRSTVCKGSWRSRANPPRTLMNQHDMIRRLSHLLPLYPV